MDHFQRFYFHQTNLCHEVYHIDALSLLCLTLGRFLYADFPNEQGEVVLDFNEAYSPACMFTQFAACPLPPKRNALPFSIEAGEKKYDELH